MTEDEISAFDVLEDVHALDAAKVGDFAALSAKIRADRELTQEERIFIADFLVGKVKADRRAKRRMKTVEDHLAIASLILAIEAVGGGPREAAIVEVAAITGASRRKIQMALKTHGAHPGRLAREVVPKAMAERFARKRK